MKFDALAAEAPLDHPQMARLRAARAEVAGDVTGAVDVAPAGQASATVPTQDEVARLPTTVARALMLSAEEADVATDAIAVLHGLRARLLFNAGDKESAARTLISWRDAHASIPATTFPARLQSLSEIGECLSELGEESLVAAAYEELADWKALRLGGGGRGGANAPSRALDSLRGALGLRLGKDAEAEEWYRIGLEWAERERCPIEQGRCLQGLAEVAERHGQHREAAQYLDRAALLFQRHGAKLYLDQVLKKKEILRA